MTFPSRSYADKLETVTRELLLQVGDISIEVLRRQAEADDENDRTVGS
jgi:hypothetical protein